MSCLIAKCFLLGLAAFAADSKDPDKAEMPPPLHFRLEVKTDEVVSMMGRIEASEEHRSTYDKAVLDMDGDGTLEKTIALSKSPNPAPKGYFRFTFDLLFEDRHCQLELLGRLSDPFEKPLDLDWYLFGPSQHMFFINGKTHVYATAEEAAKGKSIRLGPPFRFLVKTTTRGPKALVHVALKDGNDCTLRVAVRKNMESRKNTLCPIRIAFSADGETRSTLDAEYG